MFLIRIGKLLYSLGPCTWNEFSRNVLIFPVLVSVGILQVLPSLNFVFDSSPQLAPILPELSTHILCGTSPFVFVGRASVNGIVLSNNPWNV